MDFIIPILSKFNTFQRTLMVIPLWNYIIEHILCNLRIYDVLQYFMLGQQYSTLQIGRKATGMEPNMTQDFIILI